jgi:hypothetical protein
MLGNFENFEKLCVNWSDRRLVLWLEWGQPANERRTGVVAEAGFVVSIATIR